MAKGDREPRGTPLCAGRGNLDRAFRDDHRHDHDYPTTRRAHEQPDQARRTR